MKITMRPHIETTLKDKLNLYFFDPKKDEDEYTAWFWKTTNQKKYKAYSPLYLLRRQILLLSGELIKFKPPIHQTPYFSAILLSNIAIIGLTELLNYKKGARGYNDFYLKYLGKDPIQQLGLRTLRNALEHNNFQLFTRLEKNKRATKKFFTEMLDYFKNSKDINETELNEIESFKVYFKLIDDKGTAIITSPKIAQKYGHYLLVEYRVRPFKYLKKLEKGIAKIHKEISEDRKLQELFDRTITIDNWMAVSSG
jgi:hypothetical protein